MINFRPNENDCSKCDYWDNNYSFCGASYCVLGREKRMLLNKKGLK